MRTKISNFIIAIVFIPVLVLTSCEVDIPEVDSVPPGFTFTVTGNGRSQQFTERSDFTSETLQLVRDSVYTFAYWASDMGGVSSAEWTIAPNDGFVFDDLNPALVIDQNLGLSRKFTLVGSLSEPLSSLSLTGTFQIPEGSGGEGMLAPTFRFTVRDFGGEMGDQNITSRELRVLVGVASTR